MGRVNAAPHLGIGVRLRHPGSLVGVADGVGVPVTGLQVAGDDPWGFGALLGEGNGQIVIPRAGLYLGTIEAQVTVDTAGDVNHVLSLDGFDTGGATDEVRANSATHAERLVASTVGDLAAGDLLTVEYIATAVGAPAWDIDLVNVLLVRLGP